MAFATSNTRAGVAGNLRLFAGDWSGAVGDSAGTVTLNGGRVYSCRFENQDGDSGKWTEAANKIATSGSTITVTVYNKEAVTNGRFLIVYA